MSGEEFAVFLEGLTAEAREAMGERLEEIRAEGRNAEGVK